ncbi:unnamed protein product [marine sediment metagenome]|uniref:Uncharacterized protein n=1 Tax=marine sediment metagenome TaxID=412755 RepID=X1MA87_9ZZZZ
MNEEDVKAFLDDYKKADTEKKLDMWFFALDQEEMWEELLTKMSMIAQMQNTAKKTIEE